MSGEEQPGGSAIANGGVQSLLDWLVPCALLLGLWGPPRFERLASSQAYGRLVQGELDGTAQLQLVGSAAIVVTAALAMIWFMVEGRDARRSKVPVLLHWYGGYFAITVASTLWSSMPSYTAYKFAILGSVLMMNLYLLKRKLTRRLVDVFLVYSGACFLNNLLFMWMDPARVYMNTRLIGGGYFAPDYGIAAYSVFAAGLALFITKRRLSSLVGVALCAAAAAMILESRTRGILIPTFVLSPLVLVVFSTTFRGRVLAGVVAMVTIAITIAWWGDFSNVLLRGGEQLETLSGRVDLWEFYWDYWLESPLAGYGYGAGVRSAQIEHQVGIPHNDLLTAFVSVGILGSLPLTVAVVMASVRLLGVVIRRNVGPDGFRTLVVVCLGFFLLSSAGFGGVFAADGTSSAVLSIGILTLAGTLPASGSVHSNIQKPTHDHESNRTNRILSPPRRRPKPGDVHADARA